MPRKMALQEIKKALAGGKRIHKLLDWERRSLKVNGCEIGHLLNQTLWGFLTSLALIRSRKPGLLTGDEDVLPPEHLVNSRVPARNCRRELGRRLSHSVAQLFVQNVYGLGYRLMPDVRVPGRSEAPLRFRNPADVTMLSDQLQAVRSTAN